MTSFISHTTIDARNAYELSEWWKPVLGYADIDGDPNLPGHEECMIRDPETGHQCCSSRSPTPSRQEPPPLRPAARAPAPATRSSRPCWRTAPPVVTTTAASTAPASGWVTLADPEGNEFCILRSLAELS